MPSNLNIISAHANFHHSSNDASFIQENVLQSFKLPRPVVCVGGVVQIELMGRVQKQEMDDLYYIW